MGEDAPTGLDTLTDTVGWLRLRRGGVDGIGVAAALCVTDRAGLPVCFARLAMPSSRGNTGSMANALKSLVGTVPAAPKIVVAVAEELDVATAADLGVPVCRVPSPDLRGGPEQGAWAAPPPVRVESVLLAVRSAATSRDMLVRVATADAAVLDDRRIRDAASIPGIALTLSVDLTDPANAGLDLAGRIAHILRMPPDDPAPPATNPGADLTWPAPLMPFQQHGVRALLDRDRLLLADDMGLGKTVQAIAALRIKKARGEDGQTLVIAPTSVLDQWRRELAKWAPELTAIIVRGAPAERVWKWRAQTDFKLASYGVLRQDAWRREVAGRRWDTVVADEAQRIKNRIATSDAVKRLRRRRSWALTGTPVENREDELASIMEFVDHDGEPPLRRYAPGRALLERHRAVQLRRRKADVLDDLPPKLVSTRAIELLAQQRDSYDRAEQEGVVFLKSLGADVTIVHVLELITRLKQICNADPRTGASCKLDDIAGRIEELTERGHKAVVFSQYVSVASGVKLAASRLAAFDPLVLTGEVPAVERPALIDRFKSGPHQALIVSLGVGGVGLNLQEASYVFHLDRWWNPAVERQAEDRVHRIGQTVKVHVVKYTCVDTIEERIDRILADKQALFDELVDDVSIDLAANLNREELLGLFGL